MASHPLISIIIPNWNGKEFIDQCLKSATNQTYRNVEIVVFDNASQDGSNEIVKERYPQVKLIENEKNIGFARANNAGVEAAAGEFIFLINNDTILDPDCLDNLYSMWTNTECSCLTAKMLFPDRKTIDHAGGMYSRLGIALDRGLLNRDENQYNVPIKIDYAHGSCLFMQRELYLKLGGFDPDFFQFVEDVDMGLKLKALGHSTYYCPDAKMVHYDGGTTGRENRRRSKFMVTNLAATMIKTYSLPALILFFPLFSLSRLGLGLAYLLKGRADLFAGVMEGFAGIPSAARPALKKRKLLQSDPNYRMFRSEFGILYILKEALYYFFQS